MNEKYNVNINSEIGKLNTVILHEPGIEIERMTPENAAKALYSDILNLKVSQKEYSLFKQSLSKVANTLEVTDLLTDILEERTVREELISQIFNFENIDLDINKFLEHSSRSIANRLIQGQEIADFSSSSAERYIIKPLFNFFFTRDASISIGNNVLIGKMANAVRQREAIIMNSIFRNHKYFKADTYQPKISDSCKTECNIEGGDVLIAREDVILVGTGTRTTSQGIEFIVDQLSSKTPKGHFFLQELPDKPESFIHLDMVFTFLDRDCCMIYEPVIMSNNYRTTHITVENGKVVKKELVNNLIEGLNSVGFNISSVICGGEEDKWNQHREQWHSGANFFSFAPGKIIGYERNYNTLEALNKNGFEIIRAEDFVNGIKNPDDYKRAIIAIESSELVRGGGGARCMTMPVNRDNVIW